jgi:hypothetical protein
MYNFIFLFASSPEMRFGFRNDNLRAEYIALSVAAQIAYLIMIMRELTVRYAGTKLAVT